MSVGLPISRTEIDISSGDTARAFQRAFEDAAIMQFYLAGEAELVALGYTTQEVAILMTSYNDLEFLGRVWVARRSCRTRKSFACWSAALGGAV